MLIKVQLINSLKHFSFFYCVDPYLNKNVNYIDYNSKHNIIIYLIKKIQLSTFYCNLSSYIHVK